MSTEIEWASCTSRASWCYLCRSLIWTTTGRVIAWRYVVLERSASYTAPPAKDSKTMCSATTCTNAITSFLVMLSMQAIR